MRILYIFRRTFSCLGYITLLGGGVLFLSGCHSQPTEANGVPIPAPHAAPPVQVQIQDVNSNTHIPAAQKAMIESHISGGNGVTVDKTPTQMH